MAPVLRTYSRNKAKSFDLFDSLFAKNLVERNKARSTKNSVNKDLKSPTKLGDESNAVDSLLANIEVDNTFDKILKGNTYNEVLLKSNVHNVTSDADTSSIPSLSFKYTVHTPVIRRTRKAYVKPVLKKNITEELSFTNLNETTHQIHTSCSETENSFEPSYSTSFIKPCCNNNSHSNSTHVISSTPVIRLIPQRIINKTNEDISPISPSKMISRTSMHISESLQEIKKWDYEVPDFENTSRMKNIIRNKVLMKKRCSKRIKSNLYNQIKLIAKVILPKRCEINDFEGFSPESSSGEDMQNLSSVIDNLSKSIQEISNVKETVKSHKKLIVQVTKIPDNILNKLQNECTTTDNLYNSISYEDFEKFATSNKVEFCSAVDHMEIVNNPESVIIIDDDDLENPSKQTEASIMIDDYETFKSQKIKHNSTSDFDYLSRTKKRSNIPKEAQNNSTLDISNITCPYSYINAEPTNSINNQTNNSPDVCHVESPEIQKNDSSRTELTNFTSHNSTESLDISALIKNSSVAEILNKINSTNTLSISIIKGGINRKSNIETLNSNSSISKIDQNYNSNSTINEESKSDNISINNRNKFITKRKKTRKTDEDSTEFLNSTKLSPERNYINLRRKCIVLDSSNNKSNKTIDDTIESIILSGDNDEKSNIIAENNASDQFKDTHTWVSVETIPPSHNSPTVFHKPKTNKIQEIGTNEKISITSRKPDTIHLTPGKCWRRSLSIFKRNNLENCQNWKNETEICLGTQCTCAKCKQNKLLEQSVCRRSILLVRDFNVAVYKSPSFIKGTKNDTCITEYRLSILTTCIPLLKTSSTLNIALEFVRKYPSVDIKSRNDSSNVEALFEKRFNNFKGYLLCLQC